MVSKFFHSQVPTSPSLANHHSAHVPQVSLSLEVSFSVSLQFCPISCLHGPMFNEGASQQLTSWYTTLCACFQLITDSFLVFVKLFPQGLTDWNTVNHFQQQLSARDVSAKYLWKYLQPHQQKKMSPCSMQSILKANIRNSAFLKERILMLMTLWT